MNFRGALGIFLEFMGQNYQRWIFFGVHSNENISTMCCRWQWLTKQLNHFKTHSIPFRMVQNGNYTECRKWFYQNIAIFVLHFETFSQLIVFILIYAPCTFIHITYWFFFSFSPKTEQKQAYIQLWASIIIENVHKIWIKIMDSFNSKLVGFSK